MPNAQMILVAVVEDERRSDEPDPKRQLSDLVPPAQSDYFQLRQHEHGQSDHGRVQNNGWTGGSS